MRWTNVLRSEFKYFKRYIERELSEGRLRVTTRPIVGTKIVGRKKSFYYDENRPWTEQFKRNNMDGMAKKPVPIVPIEDWTIFKGDRVELLVGKDKGKHGVVSCVIRERNWCFVEALNCDYRMEQSSPDLPCMCIRDERPLLANTQVRLVDPADEKPTDVEWRYTEEGERLRISVRTGRAIPLPALARELQDGVLASTYQENKTKDTSEKVLKETTFTPTLTTFEQEIMDAMGIKESRIKAKTFWY